MKRYSSSLIAVVVLSAAFGGERAIAQAAAASAALPSVGMLLFAQAPQQGRGGGPADPFPGKKHLLANLTGVGTQRPFQLLADVYSPNRTYSNYLNPKAFGTPGPGQISTMRPFSVLNLGTVSFDFSLARWFAITERQKVQVRADVLNAPNIANAPPPVTSLNATNFGQMAASSVGGNTAPGLSTTGNRVMQFSMKYVF